MSYFLCQFPRISGKKKKRDCLYVNFPSGYTIMTTIKNQNKIKIAL